MSRTPVNDSNFYLPGEEINLRQDDLFVNWEAKSHSGFKTNKRLSVIICIIAFVYILVAIRLLGTCVLPHLKDAETETVVYAIKKNFHRSDIVDTHGTIVATSLPTKDLDANIKNILSRRKTAERLAEIFPEKSFDYFYKRLKNGRGTITLRRNLSPHQQSLIMALGDPGLEFRASEKRVYPHKNLLSHLVGTADIDNNGTSGIEKGLNERITTSDIPVQLSIDIGVQDTIRTILFNNMKKFHADNATAILMDVNTGKIISMVSLPDFDPNNISGTDTTAQFNIATKRVYEPGSV
ncbi:MAG: hypothetical protein MJ210_04455, partial [Alphaproteobacteria bacterium]|nr:hypothetical protein [Alphaproteobacteria bacterium]